MLELTKDLPFFTYMCFILVVVIPDLLKIRPIISSFSGEVGKKGMLNSL